MEGFHHYTIDSMSAAVFDVCVEMVGWLGAGCCGWLLRSRDRGRDGEMHSSDRQSLVSGGRQSVMENVCRSASSSLSHKMSQNIL
jgi:hypothetical protein